MCAFFVFCFICFSQKHTFSVMKLEYFCHKENSALNELFFSHCKS